MRGGERLCRLSKHTYEVDKMIDKMKKIKFQKGIFFKTTYWTLNGRWARFRHGRGCEVDFNRFPHFGFEVDCKKSKRSNEELQNLSLKKAKAEGERYSQR